ncbi:cell wall metabolism sensor histidine kinase WalK [Shimazuella sp. AN120528]|uniref:sensor histidine kinase n=1 Tax=Shimazuella soli TaxID=1892854 RepID=UPI001F0EE11A|nr:ATP-binding protein [Shimazuella soli]MCH5586650.1 cell wall metabolism sensor histidine kinase WalK [Shimazuella soli]
MKKKLLWTFITVASVMVALASVIYLIEMHHHVSMYQKKFPLPNSHQIYYDYHFEQAIIQSTVWTAIGTIFLAVLVSYYIANRISSPLTEMRHVAEQMIKGNWESRVKVKGNDEVANLGEALNVLTSQLQEHEVLRQHLTSDIAHELRTPLATLKSHMEAFEDGVWKPTPERIHSCQEELDRLIHLVGDLEQLTKVESPGFSLKCKEENLVDIVKQIFISMEANFKRKQVRWKLEAPHQAIVWVDRNRMSQIIINLLTNALTYTPSGGIVTISIIIIEKKVKIIIQDTGIGIPDAELARVFERFYRVDKSRSRKLGGNGIGLAIVKKLVEAHKGIIRIESKVGEGTSVTISIPTAK